VLRAALLEEFSIYRRVCVPGRLLHSSVRSDFANEEIEVAAGVEGHRQAAASYSHEALRQDLLRVRVAWEGVQSSRDRNAIYGYLTAVYGLVAWWIAEGRAIDRVRRALRLQRLNVSDREDPFAAVIRCTAAPGKAGKRTRSKWSRLIAVCGDVRAGSRTAGPVHTSEGGHQCMCGSFHPESGARLK
jgi:hypothetical protein